MKSARKCRFLSEEEMKRGKLMLHLEKASEKLSFWKSFLVFN